jgi:hypothetical protein
MNYNKEKKGVRLGPVYAWFYNDIMLDANNKRGKIIEILLCLWERWSEILSIKKLLAI